jgi:hypothetical protein
MTLRRSAGCRRTSVSILLGAIIGLAACGQGTDTTGTGGDLVAPDSTVDSSASEDGDLDNGETDESEQDGESDAGTDTDTGSDTETGANTETGADPDAGSEDTVPDAAPPTTSSGPTLTDDVLPWLDRLDPDLVVVRQDGLVHARIDGQWFKPVSSAIDDRLTADGRWLIAATDLSTLLPVFGGAVPCELPGEVLFTDIDQQGLLIGHDDAASGGRPVECEPGPVRTATFEQVGPDTRLRPFGGRELVVTTTSHGNLLVTDPAGSSLIEDHFISSGPAFDFDRELLVYVDNSRTEVPWLGRDVVVRRLETFDEERQANLGAPSAEYYVMGGLVDGVALTQVVTWDGSELGLVGHELLDVETGDVTRIPSSIELLYAGP